MKKIFGTKNMAIRLCFGFFALFLCLQALVVFALPLFGDDYYYATFVRSSEYFRSGSDLYVTVCLGCTSHRETCGGISYHGVLYLP